MQVPTVPTNLQPPVVSYPVNQSKGQILPPVPLVTPVTPQQQQRKRKQQSQKTKPLLHASVYISCFVFGLILVVLGFLFYFVFVRKTVSIQVTKVYKTDGVLTKFDYYYKNNSSKTGTMKVPGYLQRNADWKLNFLSNFQNSNKPISLYANKKNKLWFTPRNKAAYLCFWIVGFILLICGVSYFFDKH